MRQHSCALLLLLSAAPNNVLFGTCAINVRAQAEAQAKEPEVLDNFVIIGGYDVAGYDVEALKASDWVEHEIEMTGGENFKAKRACLTVDGDTAWIETNWNLWQHSGTVFLLAVNRSDRKVAKAWWGKPGAKGKELKVKAYVADPSLAEIEQEMWKTETKGTGKVSKEKLQVNGMQLDCERTDLDYVMTNPGWTTGKKNELIELKETKSKWIGEQVPFRAFSSAKVTYNLESHLKWEGKRTIRGGTVKSVTESPNFKWTMTLVGWGTDAKGTLQE